MQQPTDQQRVFSASDVAQFEYCPLAWWYEEMSEVAQADQAELERHLDELEEEYGASASTLPEYQVIERLIQRAQRFEQGKAQHAGYGAQEAEQEEAEGSPGQVRPLRQAAEEIITQPPPPRLFAVIAFGLVALTVLLLAFGVWLWLR